MSAPRTRNLGPKNEEKKAGQGEITASKSDLSLFGQIKKAAGDFGKKKGPNPLLAPNTSQGGAVLRPGYGSIGE